MDNHSFTAVEIEALQDLCLQLSSIVKNKRRALVVLPLDLIWTVRMASRLASVALDWVTHSLTSCKRHVRSLSSIGQESFRPATILDAAVPTPPVGLNFGLDSIASHFYLFTMLQELTELLSRRDTDEHLVKSYEPYDPYPYVYFNSDWVAAAPQEYDVSNHPLIQTIERYSTDGRMYPGQPCASKKLQQCGMTLLDAQTFDRATYSSVWDSDRIKNKKCQKIVRSIWLVDKSRQTQTVGQVLVQQLRLAFIETFCRCLVDSNMLLVELCVVVFDYVMDLNEILCFNLQLRRVSPKK